jgi:hypothetical protein
VVAGENLRLGAGVVHIRRPPPHLPAGEPGYNGSSFIDRIAAASALATSSSV